MKSLKRSISSWGLSAALLLGAIGGLPEAAAARDSSPPGDTSGDNSGCIKKCDEMVVLCWTLAVGVPILQAGCAATYSQCLDNCGWKPGQVIGAPRCLPLEERLWHLQALPTADWPWLLPA